MIRDNNDPRVNFVCLDFPDIPEHIDSFPDAETLNENLDKFVAEIVAASVNIDTVQGEFLVPKVFQTYRDDFGNNDESVVRFVFKYLQPEDIDEETAVREVCNRRSLMLRYE